MTPQEFCYWLQGLLELQPDLRTLNEAQVQMIRDHLGYVFTHVQASKAKTPATLPSVPFSPNGMETLIGITPPHAIAIC